MRKHFERPDRALFGLGLVAAVGCAGIIPGLGGGGGTVRILNATVATPICRIGIGFHKTLKVYEQRIEPGASVELAATDPGPAGEPQQPVKIEACEAKTFMVENITFAQGKKHMVVLFDGTDPPAVETPPGFARYDLRNSRDGSRMVNLPRWQDEKGMKADWFFFSLRSKCDHNMDYKFTPSTKASEVIEPIPADGYKFWHHRSTYTEVGDYSTKPVTLWLRDVSKKGDGNWIEAHQMQPGTSARLEIDKSCKKIVERTDDERYHGCYEWVYSPACKLSARISKQPEGCPDGTPSVEGDTSRTCEIKTDQGLCTVRYAHKSAGCDVR